MPEYAINECPGTLIGAFGSIQVCVTEHWPLADPKRITGLPSKITGSLD
ncbi:hypothetical protein [Spirosoma sp. KNUC1025]|nr:hypothetical protein LN737_15690 [Spirosoma sp. KNUC1025]